MQAVLQAQAAAASQHAAMAAAAAGGGNVFGHISSYNNAIELGMGGEWVHEVLQQPGHDAPPWAPPREARDTEGLTLLMREVDEGDIYMDGGFIEDMVPPLPSLQQEQPPAREPAAVVTVADELSGAIGSASTAAAAAAGPGSDMEESPCPGTCTGSGSVPGIRPELVRMSGYQPRLSLLTIEVADDESLSALLDYLGR